MRINRNAFTLVELIVVLTILAILGTISFISLQGYSKQARDSRRISDISNIKTSLELFQLNTGKYPLPDDGGEVSYSGELLWTQGVVGNNVTMNLGKNLQKKPTDPLYGVEYIYSTTSVRKEYELLAVYEGDISYSQVTSSTHAANFSKPKISGNFNGLFIRTAKYLIPTPSIITSEILPLDFKNNQSAINSQVITNGDNLPIFGLSNIETKTGKLNIKLSVYTGSIDENITELEKTKIINTIQSAYSGSSIGSKGIYANILNSQDLSIIEHLLILNGNKGGESCNFDGNDIGDGESVTAFEKSIDNVCVSEERTCNNGNLTGSYNFPSCDQPLVFELYNGCGSKDLNGYWTSGTCQGRIELPSTGLHKLNIIVNLNGDHKYYGILDTNDTSRVSGVECVTFATFKHNELNIVDLDNNKIIYEDGTECGFAKNANGHSYIIMQDTNSGATGNIKFEEVL